MAAHVDIQAHGQGLRYGPAAAGAVVLAAALSVAVPACAEQSTNNDPWAAKRAAMLETVRAHARFGPTPIGERVLEALARVPRHELVPPAVRAQAYDDTPLPIGYGQTISQPYIVALMTELARVKSGDKVLEIGTGSGYQAAVLAELGARVFTIEIVDELGRRAERNLERLGYTNVTVRIGDGYKGWPEHAPFDAILVTAAPETIPQPLLKQLAAGGRLVVPVGPRGATQQLTVVEKSADGRTTTRRVLPVRFVPLVRED